MTEREISEKELVFEMLDDTDVDIVLMAFRESPKNKNPQFKRMKVKQHINAVKTKTNRLTPFEFLGEQLRSEEFKQMSLTKLLRLFNNPEADIPNVVKYFTLRGCHPKFFQAHYEEFKANILKGKFFLDGVQIFESEEDLRKYYIETFGYEQSSYDRYIDTLIEWYETHIHSLKEEFELMKGLTVCEFDAKRRQLRDDYNDTGLILAMLKVGDLDQELKEIFLSHCIHDCLVERNLKITSKFKEKGEEFVKEVTELTQLNKDLKKTIKTYEQEVKALKKAHERECKQMEATWITRLEALESALKEEEAMQRQQCDKISSLEERNQALEEQVQLQSDLAASYKWSLQSDYTPFGVLVLHQSTLLYAKQLFPDIQFVTDLTAVDLKKPIKQLLIQKYGLPHQKRRQAQVFAQTHGLRVLELDGREEREQIIALSNYLTKLTNVE